MRYIYPLILVSLLTNCSGTLTDPQQIVNKAIEQAGGDRFQQSKIEFDFRNRHYVVTRNGGSFTYERIFKENENNVHDYLNNDGFYREINGSRVDVADSMAAKYTRSVNSVIYFALLPYGLNDGAVHKKILQESVLDGIPYYKIEVTFSKEGGGEDYEDVFHYWINKKTFIVDYFSYTYNTDGGGIRFRKAIKQHRYNGILLQDYINYQPKEMVTLNELESLFISGDLEELSKIELSNITVSISSDL